MEFPKYDMESELRRFRPLVTATARRYAGRGAEFDDLVQEGYLALLELVPRCGDPERLPLFLKNRLPARVRLPPGGNGGSSTFPWRMWKERRRNLRFLKSRTFPTGRLRSAFAERTGSL